MNNCCFEFRKYEIIAILRAAIKENKYAILELDASKIEHQILKVDSRGIYFKSFIPDIYLGNEVNVTFISKNAKYHFTFIMYESKFEFLDNQYCWILDWPEGIEICQRRKQPRMSIPTLNNYNSNGRSNKGVFYSFDIRNLSKGGCTVISKPIYTGIKSAIPCIGETFNNLNFDFGTLGCFSCNMTIVNKKTDHNGTLLFSCKFRNPNKKTQLTIDEIITKLIVKSK